MAQPSREMPLLASALVCVVGSLISGSDLLLSRLNDESASSSSWPGLIVCAVALAGVIVQHRKRGLGTRDHQATSPTDETPAP